MKVFCVAGIFWAQSLWGQSFHAMPIPIESAMMVTERFSDPVNCFQHPAAFAQQKSIAGFVYSEKKIGLKELNSFCAAVTIPMNQSGMGLLMNSQGIEGYKEGRLSVAYAKHLGKVSIGAQFNYTQINATGYGTSSVLSAGVGIGWWLSNKLVIGVSIMDPGNQEFSKSEERLAWVYKIGLGYELSDKVLIAVAARKEKQQKTSLEFGIIYKIAERFYFKAGYLTERSGPYLNAGWGWKSFRIEACTKYHLQLGFSQGLLFLFSIQKKTV